MTEKHLSANALSRDQMSDVAEQRFFVMLPEDVEPEDIFHPFYWRHHAGNTRLFENNTVIRLRSAVGAFDFDVVLTKKVAGGLVVEYRCGRVPEGFDPFAAARDALSNEGLKLVPIGGDGKPIVRVDFTQKSKHRLIGLNGQEVIRDLDSKAAAEREMAKYLASARLRMPTEAEIQAWHDARQQPAA